MRMETAMSNIEALANLFQKLGMPDVEVHDCVAGDEGEDDTSELTIPIAGETEVSFTFDCDGDRLVRVAAFDPRLDTVPDAGHVESLFAVAKEHRAALPPRDKAILRDALAAKRAALVRRSMPSKLRLVAAEESERG